MIRGIFDRSVALSARLLAGLIRRRDRLPLQGALSGDPGSGDLALVVVSPTSVCFVCLTHKAGSAFAALAADIAACARSGDRVLLVDDGPINDDWDQSGWGQGVTAERIVTGARDGLGTTIARDGLGTTIARDGLGTAIARDGLGAAINLALAYLALPGRGAARIVFLQAGSRLDSGAWGRARARAEAEDLDLMVCLMGQSRVDLASDLAPDLATWPAYPGEAPREHALRLAPVLGRMLIRSALLAGPPPLRCAEGQRLLADLELQWQVLARATRVGISAEATGQSPALPEGGPDMAAPLAALVAADPAAAGWLAAVLAQQGPGVRGAILTAAAPFRALPVAVLAQIPARAGPLVQALARGDGRRLRAELAPLITPVPVPVLVAPALARGARLRLACEGRHVRRMPFSYAALRPLWQDWADLTDDPATADLILYANPRDLADMRPAAVVPGANYAILSEEPFWDSLFSPAPLARRIMLQAGPLGSVAFHQVNHHRSAIYDFDIIPYFLLTEPHYAARYAHAFVRNAALSPADWAAAFAVRPQRAVFMAEYRPEPFHDIALPQGDVIGLCAWRTRLAQAYGTGSVARIGASWGTGQSRFAVADWHADKLAQLDGRTQILSAIENTHQPTYISEKIFDAFACGARPLYVASPGHRLHDLGLPPGSWINLYGLDSADGPAAIDAAPWDDAFYASYAAAQNRLAAMWTDVDGIAHERARLGRALQAEMERLAEGGPA